MLAPAMNTQMYTHPITTHHIALIKHHLPYIEFIQPIEKILACGDVGMGGMAEWGDVVGRVVRKLNLRIRPESEEDEDGNVVGELDEDTKDEGERKNDDSDEDDDEDSDEEEDEGIRAGGEEHEDEKRDNEEREREEEEEERQHMSRLASRVDLSQP